VADEGDPHFEAAVAQEVAARRSARRGRRLAVLAPLALAVAVVSLALNAVIIASPGTVGLADEAAVEQAQSTADRARHEQRSFEEFTFNAEVEHTETIRRAASETCRMLDVLVDLSGYTIGGVAAFQRSCYRQLPQAR
jgi:hypothetical protein